MLSHRRPLSMFWIGGQDLRPTALWNCVLHQNCTMEGATTARRLFSSVFLEFIDSNSQPNGRRVGSHGPLFFLSSKFSRINAPSEREAAGKSGQWKQRSLVYEFNRTLEGNARISNGTAKKWLKAHRAQYAICPRKTDYCEICVECREQIKRHEVIAFRLRQEGNDSEERIRESEALAESYGLLLEEHRLDAANELENYRQRVKESRSLYEQVEELRQKGEAAATEGPLSSEGLAQQVVFTLSVDYQQSKLTPHWGHSAQPSETYYLRKLSHNIFGVVDHTLDRSAVYLVDERTGGAKNADITISLLDHYIRQNLPSYARHLRVFMDNGATNKNQYMLQWAAELVGCGEYETIRMCFFVPGHGKSDVDRLFSRIAHTYDTEDVFTTEQLATLIQNAIGTGGKCIRRANSELVNWKSLLPTKYTALKDIKSYRDFLVKRDAKGKIVVNCKECCYAGDYVPKRLLKSGADENMDLRREVLKHTYQVRELSFELSQEKTDDLIKMYDKFIDADLRPEWLPRTSPGTIPRMPTPTPSSDFARQHRAESKGKRGRRKPSD